MTCTASEIRKRLADRFSTADFIAADISPRLMFEAAMTVAGDDDGEVDEGRLRAVLSAPVAEMLPELREADQAVWRMVVRAMDDIEAPADEDGQEARQMLDALLRAA